jgi:vacuolar-type H+-ATPase subunit H
MGARESASGTASDVGGKAQAMASGVADTVRSAPDTVARQTQGNPLAAGMIAFGVGLLAASLLPETRAERRVGVAVAERSEGLVDKAREAGRELTEELGGTARQAAEHVKETAKQAAENTADHAKEAGRTTVQETKQAAR